MRRSILIYLILIIHVYTFARSPIATTEGEPSSIVGGCLNAITGEAIFQENDIVIAGVEPIRLPRIYLSGAREGEGKGWFYTSDLFAVFSEKDDRFSIPERNGTILKYIRERGSKGRCRDFKKKKGYRFVPEITENGKGWTNSAKGSLSGRNNQKNYNVFLDHDKEQLHVYRADGSSRLYKKVKGSYELFALQSEKLPNGNNVTYGYDDYGRLDSIETKNPASTVRYAFAHFHFWGKPSESQNVDIETSDGRYLSYRYRREGPKDNPSYYLMEVSAPGIQSEHIEYLPQVTNPPPLVNKRMFPNGRVLATDFYHKGLNIVGDAWVDIPTEADPRYERVKAIMAPVGKDGTLHLAMRMFYYPESFFSQVFDLYGNLTVYHYTPQQRLSKIERLDNHSGNRTLYHTETLAWGPQGSPYEGFLFCKSLLNPQGLGIRSYRYLYDAFGNVIEEDVYGNLSGQCKQPLIIDGNHHPSANGIEKYVVVRSYTQDDRHLLLSEHYPNGLSKRFQYIPDTDLLRAEFHCENGRIVQRHFYYYNQDLILSAEVLDDGETENDADLTGVTQRTKRVLKLRGVKHLYGMPEVIEERYIDLATGKENLLSKTAIDYTTGGKISRKDIYDASGEFRYSLEFHYDGSGNLIKETNPIGQASTYEYDANLNRVRYTEPDNRCSHFYTYDFVNRLIEEKIQTHDGGEHTVRCEYDFTDNKIAEQDTFGNTTRHTYNGFGSPLTTTLSEVQDEDGTSYHPSIIREVDCEGHVIKETGPKGTTKEITYNARGKPIEVRHPDGTFETFTYNLDGQLRSSTNTDGTTTSFTYDVFGRETSVTITSASQEVLQKSRKEYTTFHLARDIDPNGNITEYFYDGAGRLEAEEFHHGDKTERTEYAYDTLGRLFSTRKGDEVQIVDRDLLGRTIEERVENSAGDVLRKTCTSYNAAGDVELVRLWIDGKESQEYFFYDGFHRLIQHLDPLGNKTQYSYDENALDDFGRRVLQKTTIDPIGVQTIETFDVLGRLIHIIKRAPFETTLAEETLIYDRGGNLARHIHSVIASGTTLRQRAIHLYYDNMERLVHSIDGYGSTSPRSTEHSYTSTGQLETTTKPDGIVITRSYNPLGRLTEIQTSDGSCRYTFAYDGTGTLLQATDVNTQHTFTRTVDGRGRLQEEVLPSGLVINREYDEQGNRKTLTLPDNSFVSYSFDGCNIASIQRHDPSGALAYAHHFRHYDLSGNLLAEDPIDNHTSITYHYDPLGRRSSVHSSWHKQTITDYDPRGLVKSVDWQNPLGAYTESFDYDELHQLTAENSLISHHYRYDSQGNRLVKDHAAMRIDDNNQLLFDAETHYNYDPNGNIESAETSGSKIRYTYDAFDRLITISSSDQIIRFTYDGIHRRISKTVESTSWSGPKAETTFYLYDNYFEIGSVNASGVIQNLRILGRTPKAETGAAIALEIHGKAYIPLHDIRGSVIALANPTNGKIEESYRYTSFGEEEVYDASNTRLKTSRIGNPWRFASKRIDEETKFICFGRRYYIPKLGRWMTPDPEGYTDGPNLYSFLLNNPLACFDLYGLTALADKNDIGLLDRVVSSIKSGAEAAAKGIANGIRAATPAAQQIGSVARDVVHYTGETIYQTFHHAPHLPIITPLGKWIGNLLSKNDHAPYSRRHYSAGNKSLPGDDKILYINGVLNTPEDLQHSLDELSKICDGTMVESFYRKTHGLSQDIIYSAAGLLGYDQGDGKRLAEFLTEQLGTGNGRVLLYTHSAGNILFDLARKHLTTEQLNRIHLVTLGSPRYINDKRLGDYENYACKNDFVSMLSPSFHFGKYTKLSSQKLIEHSFTGETYKRQIKNTFKNFTKQPLE